MSDSAREGRRTSPRGSDGRRRGLREVDASGHPWNNQIRPISVRDASAIYSYSIIAYI